MQMTQIRNGLHLPCTETSMTFTYFIQKNVHYIKSLFSHNKQNYQNKNPKKWIKNNKLNYICT